MTEQARNGVGDGVICKVRELQPGDKIAYGTLLGLLKTAEDVTVKSLEEADREQWALTLFRVGTIYVSGELLVELVPRRQYQ
jgi:hypothetical protein